jgi:hypothetical protein
MSQPCKRLFPHSGLGSRTAGTLVFQADIGAYRQWQVFLRSDDTRESRTWRRAFITHWRMPGDTSCVDLFYGKEGAVRGSFPAVIASDLSWRKV